MRKLKKIEKSSSFHRYSVGAGVGALSLLALVAISTYPSLLNAQIEKHRTNEGEETEIAEVLPKSQGFKGDPCNFSKSDAYSYDQVMQCFRSVPFSHSNMMAIKEAIEQQINWSDLAEVYDQKFQWRNALEAVVSKDYATDYDMQQAFVSFGKTFRNAHFSYWPSWCYSEVAYANIPIDFGLTTRFSKDKEQQVFIEGASEATAKLYKQKTGINVRRYIGMGVESINGVPALEYLRQAGRNIVAEDESDGVNLMGILNSSSYTMRMSNKTMPTQPADVMVLRSLDGERIRVTFPWVFMSNSTLDDAYAFQPSGTGEFLGYCNESWDNLIAGILGIPPQQMSMSMNDDESTSVDDASAPVVSDELSAEVAEAFDTDTSSESATGNTAASVASEESSIDLEKPQASIESRRSQLSDASGRVKEAKQKVKKIHDEVKKRRESREKMREKYLRKHSNEGMFSTEYFEVPPALLGKGTTEIGTPAAGVSGTKLGKKTVALRVNTFGTTDPAWYEKVSEVANVACGDSVENLIIDLRGNTGGYTYNGEWIRQHIQGVRPYESDYWVRYRQDNPQLNDWIQAGNLWDSIFVQYDPASSLPCDLSAPYGLTCQADESGDIPYEQIDWHLVPSEMQARGGKMIPMSRLTTESAYWGLVDANLVPFPGFTESSCALKFDKNHLIVLTDGMNASTGYFWPSLLKEQNAATIVTMGGYVGEEMSMGSARGGARTSMSDNYIRGSIMDYVVTQAVGMESFFSPDIERIHIPGTVDMYYEIAGMHKADRQTLHIDQSTTSDIRINAWSDSPETDGYVYANTLRAVKRQPVTNTAKELLESIE